MSREIKFRCFDKATNKMMFIGYHIIGEVSCFNGIDIFVVSAEDLLISKLIWIQDWQSAMQVEDIKNIFELPGLQLEYIKLWIEKLNLKTFDLITP